MLDNSGKTLIFREIKDEINILFICIPQHLLWCNIVGTDELLPGRPGPLNKDA